MAGKRILLVEGKDDKHVVCHLANHHSIPEVFEIVECNNDEHLLKSIPIRFKTSDLECLAVILDADHGISQRWDQLKHRLNQVPGVSLPDVPDTNGTIIQIPDGPTFGVWLMPDNRLSGMLEDFLAFLVPRNDALLPLVDEFISAIPPSERRFTDQHTPKARIHCWLSLQTEPGKPLGLAIAAKYLNADCQVTQPFIKWLRTALVD